MFFRQLATSYRHFIYFKTPVEFQMSHLARNILRDYRVNQIFITDKRLRWLERRIRDRNKNFECEFASRLMHTLSIVRDAQWIMYNDRNSHIYRCYPVTPSQAATRIPPRGLRPARDGCKLSNSYSP